MKYTVGPIPDSINHPRLGLLEDCLIIQYTDGGTIYILETNIPVKWADAGDVEFLKPGQTVTLTQE